MKVVVAGHLCLDIIPALAASSLRFEPGRLLEAGAATVVCGGGVANVGRALLKLGVATTLLGKVADDPFGDIVAAQLAAVDADAARHLRRVPGESTSYTVVLAPLGGEHMFLHHPGCNDTFGEDDVDLTHVAEADLLYFGYPPLMRRIYADGGVAFARLLERVRQLGVTTLLDMAMPDPAGASGRVDWPAFMRRTLPHVDVFMPSVGEVAQMLGRRRPDATEPTALRSLAEDLLGLGAAVVGLKLGAGGLYLRSQADPERPTGRALDAAGAAWRGRELWSPVFQAAVRGTTGAGDATIAGFVKGLADRASPEACLALATAVGAASVEALDAVSAIGTFAQVTGRLEAGWSRAPHVADASSWLPGEHGVYRGRADAASPLGG
jgi:sugar/nucleoside kinase (ribokinase family)